VVPQVCGVFGLTSRLPGLRWRERRISSQMRHSPGRPVGRRSAARVLGFGPGARGRCGRRLAGPAGCRRPRWPRGRRSAGAGDLGRAGAEGRPLGRGGPPPGRGRAGRRCPGRGGAGGRDVGGVGRSWGRPFGRAGGCGARPVLGVSGGRLDRCGNGPAPPGNPMDVLLVDRRWGDRSGGGFGALGGRVRRRGRVFLPEFPRPCPAHRQAGGGARVFVFDGSVWCVWEGVAGVGCGLGSPGPRGGRGYGFFGVWARPCACAVLLQGQLSGRAPYALPAPALHPHSARRGTAPDGRARGGARRAGRLSRGLRGPRRGLRLADGCSARSSRCCGAAGPPGPCGGCPCARGGAWRTCGAGRGQ